MATHTFKVFGNKFEVDVKYTLIKPLGQGSYGVVCSARNMETQEKVAIKKIAKAFDDVVDAKRTLREIRLMNYFDHENILGTKDILKPPSLEEFEDVYLVTELMDTDLHQIIKSPQPLTDDHCQYFLYQILRGLKYIHTAHVIHRDLKPSNLLVNANCDLKICDFGLARWHDPGDQLAYMTEYVVTRWYRAPELILSSGEYTRAIDIWSVGCIFAELLGRKPLFPGRDYVHQVRLILDIIGTPKTDEEIVHITSEKARRYVKSLPPKDPVPFSTIYPNANPAAIDLLEKMLVFNPANRITVEQCLKHPYLEQLHDEANEPVAPGFFDFSFENETSSRKDLKQQVFNEVIKCHPELEKEEDARKRAKK